MKKNLDNKFTTIYTILSIIGGVAIFITYLIDSLNIIELPWVSSNTGIIIGLLGLFWASLGALAIIMGKFTDELPRLNSIEKLVNETPNRVINAMLDVVPTKERIKGSDYSFLKMAESATKSIYVIGPNLNHFVNEPAVKQLIMRKLQLPKFKVRFLIIDQNSKEICDVMSRFALTPDFIPELRRTTREFKSWKSDFNNADFLVKKMTSSQFL